jgi:cysteinyl-tRNA synthetase
MSKSKGNFLTLRTACPTPDDVRAYRYLVVSSQYRNPLSFTDVALGAAKGALKRLDKVKIMVGDALSKRNGENIAYDGDSNIATTVESELSNFEAAIADDLSMPRASACLFSIVKLAENEFKRVSKAADDPDCSVMPPLDLAGLASVQQALEKIDKVFGIFYDVPEEKGDGGVSTNRNKLLVPDDVTYLVAQRSAAKDAKNWELADSLRFKITALGFEVKDVKGGDPIVSRNFSNE